VQAGDAFDYQLGDDPYIRHKPAMAGGRARKVIAAYSIATFPDGHVSREVMNADQIEDIRKKSRARRGPWSDPIFYAEMARKTVAKLHAKQLPMSTDLDRLMHRDDALYDFKAAGEEARQVQRPGSAAAALDWFGQGEEPGRALPPASHTPDAGEPSDQTAGADPRGTTGPEAGGSGAPAAATQETGTPPAAGTGGAGGASPEDIAYARGTEARAARATKKALPGEYRDAARSSEALAWFAGLDGDPKPAKKKES